MFLIYSYSPLCSIPRIALRSPSHLPPQDPQDPRESDVYMQPVASVNLYAGHSHQLHTRLQVRPLVLDEADITVFEHELTYFIGDDSYDGGNRIKPPCSIPPSSNK